MYPTTDLVVSHATDSVDITRGGILEITDIIDNSYHMMILKSIILGYNHTYIGYVKERSKHLYWLEKRYENVPTSYPIEKPAPINYFTQQEITIKNHPGTTIPQDVWDAAHKEAMKDMLV